MGIEFDLTSSVQDTVVLCCRAGAHTDWVCPLHLVASICKSHSLFLVSRLPGSHSAMQSADMLNQVHIWAGFCHGADH